MQNRTGPYYGHTQHQHQYTTNPVLAVGWSADPEVVGHTHTPVIRSQVDKAPGLLPLHFVGVGVEGQTVELSVLLWTTQKQQS